MQAYSLSAYIFSCKEEKNAEKIFEIIKLCLNEGNYKYENNEIKRYLKYGNIEKKENEFYCTVEYGPYGVKKAVYEVKTGENTKDILTGETDTIKLPLFFFKQNDKIYAIFGQKELRAFKTCLEKHLRIFFRENNNGSISIKPVINYDLIEKLKKSESIEKITFSNILIPKDKRDITGDERARKLEVVISANPMNPLKNLLQDKLEGFIKQCYSMEPVKECIQDNYKFEELSVVVRMNGKDETIYLIKSENGYKEVKKVFIEEEDSEKILKKLKEECRNYSKYILETYKV